MKIRDMRQTIERTITGLEQKLPALLKKAPQMRPADLPPARLALRGVHLADDGRIPSRTERERILGENDLVDMNYLRRGLQAARSVCRVALRESSGREVGYGTGFMVSERLMLTNNHVLPDRTSAGMALAEFGYELDIIGSLNSGTRFELLPDEFFLTSADLDFTLVAVEPKSIDGTAKLETFGYLRMNPQVGKINKGEQVSIIQHPSGQPKQVAIRENKLLSIEERVLWYQADTAPGSSGSPVFNDSWQVIGLHHSGVPLKDNQGRWLRKDGKTPATDDTEDSDVLWIANECIRASVIVDFVAKTASGNTIASDFLEASGRQAPPRKIPDEITSAGQKVESRTTSTGIEITIPVTLSIGLKDMKPVDAVKKDERPAATAVEAFKEPVIDRHYGSRKGYDRNFLGVNVPLPNLNDPSLATKLENGSAELLYEHFSVIMHAKRRLAILTAANVDWNSKAREPEPGKDYTRTGLNGFGKNDREKWATDERIRGDQQLADRFFEKDRQSFDKGHVVRRDDVCWGGSYDEVKRANGDTFHVTNCSPQVGAFNQSSKSGRWGQLENYIKAQGKIERYAIFAGPVFDDGNDKVFRGQDNSGGIDVQIPSRFWKLVVARGSAGLQSFGFLLKQDLKSTVWEFQVDEEQWADEFVPLTLLQREIGLIRFGKAIMSADQFGKAPGNEVVAKSGISTRAESKGKAKPKPAPARKSAKSKVKKK